jgi:putative ABC transport system permease protein
VIAFLALRSLRHRALTSCLCLLSIALSVGLFIAIDRVREGAEEGFTNTISGADLLVGARGSPLQLMLYSIFHLGSPTNNIRMNTYKDLKANPQLAWTIPISLGDSYRGHRVVGTDENFFEHYRFRGDQRPLITQGEIFRELYDVVIGSEVARKFNLKVGDPIVIAHGISETAIFEHNDTPFRIVGLISPTSTPIDKAIFITLEGMEAMHIGWETGVPSGDRPEKKLLRRHDIEPKQITSFLAGAKARFHVLRLRSMIDSYEGEPVMAAIPALALQELWQTVGYVESTLSLVSLCVLAVGLIGIVIALYTSINERRREMAILRSLGAGPFSVGGLLALESTLLVTLGSLLGLGLNYLAVILLRPVLQSQFSVYLPLLPPSAREWGYLGLVIVAGLIAGLLPALKAYRNSLQDGLTIKI